MSFLAKAVVITGLVAGLVLAVPVANIYQSAVYAGERESHDNLKCRCDGLTASPANGTAPLTVQFKADAVHDHQIRPEDNLRYHWNFGDGQTAVTEQAMVTHTYNHPGNYQAVMNLGWRGKVSERQCQTTVRVKAADEVGPAVLDTKQPTELPATGAASAALGVTASGGMGIAVRSYLKSRRSLKNQLLQ